MAKTGRRKNVHRRKTRKAGASSTQKRFEQDLHSSVQRRAEDELEQQVRAQQQQVLDEQFRDIEAQLNALQAWQAANPREPVAQAELVEQAAPNWDDLVARFAALQQHQQQNQHTGGRKHRRKRKRVKRRRRTRRR